MGDYTPLQLVRAKGALHAAGAIDTSDPLPCSGYRRVMLYGAYTPGAAGGAMRMIVEVSPFSTTPVEPVEWFVLSALSVDQSQEGEPLYDFVFNKWIGYYAEGSDDEETFTYGPINLAGVVQRMRVRFSELGMIGSPGVAYMHALFTP